ncbi:putative mitochondrial protein [Cucumis melo var. makuwa]|uniref:Putative mitochondrial protein n=1 Tax=Cucumis melo var. makuwa TaxID=1194695 RepID=A0A5D3C9R9_CUCMM|nr:putative mitochondrial protein [Cucumis melo var. makuwa]
MSSPDVKVQQAQREKMVAMIFLNGLLPKFGMAKAHILSDLVLSFSKNNNPWVPRALDTMFRGIVMIIENQILQRLFVTTVDITFTSSPSSSCQWEDDNFFIYEVTSPAPSSSTNVPHSCPLLSRVYSRRPSPQPSNSCPPSMSNSSCDLGPSDDLSIAICKALSHLGWRNAMIEEMTALDDNEETSDHSIFYRRSDNGIVLLVVYVYDIVITENDASDKKIRSQTKWYSDDANQQLVKGQLCKDPKRYRRLVRKLNYLTVTRPEIAHFASVVSQFMSSPIVDHWAAVEQILCYLKVAS